MITNGLTATVDSLAFINTRVDIEAGSSSMICPLSIFIFDKKLIQPNKNSNHKILLFHQ
jgi:hypothetical protein